MLVHPQSAEIRSNGIAYLKAISNTEKVNIGSYSVFFMKTKYSTVLTSIMQPRERTQLRYHSLYLMK